LYDQPASGDREANNNPYKYTDPTGMNSQAGQTTEQEKTQNEKDIEEHGLSQGASSVQSYGNVGTQVGSGGGKRATSSSGGGQKSGDRIGSGEPAVDARAAMLMGASPEFRRDVAIGAALLAPIGVAPLAAEMLIGARVVLGPLIFEGKAGALGGEGILVGRQLVLENFSIYSRTPGGLLNPANQLIQYAQAQGATSITVTGTIVNNYLIQTLGVTNFNMTFAATRAGLLQALSRLP
jgi:hypothetical protein